MLKLKLMMLSLCVFGGMSALLANTDPVGEQKTEASEKTTAAADEKDAEANVVQEVAAPESKSCCKSNS